MILVVTLFYFIYRFDLFEKMSFVLVTCFFIYYLIYIFVPVAEPQFYFPAIGMDSVSQGVFPSIGDYFNHNQELLPGPGYQHGFFYSLVEGSQQVGERPTAASQFACGRVDHSDDYGMACQQETVCLPDAVLSVALWSYCLHSGTLSD